MPHGSTRWMLIFDNYNSSKDYRSMQVLVSKQCEPSLIILARCFKIPMNIYQYNTWERFTALWLSWMGAMIAGFWCFDGLCCFIEFVQPFWWYSSAANLFSFIRVRSHTIFSFSFEFNLIVVWKIYWIFKLNFLS